MRSPSSPTGRLGIFHPKPTNNTADAFSQSPNRKVGGLPARTARPGNASSLSGITPTLSCTAAAHATRTAQQTPEELRMRKKLAGLLLALLLFGLALPCAASAQNRDEY